MGPPLTPVVPKTKGSRRKERETREGARKQLDLPSHHTRSKVSLQDVPMETFEEKLQEADPDYLQSLSASWTPTDDPDYIDFLAPILGNDPRSSSLPFRSFSSLYGY